MSLIASPRSSKGQRAAVAHVGEIEEPQHRSAEQRPGHFRCADRGIDAGERKTAIEAQIAQPDRCFAGRAARRDELPVEIELPRAEAERRRVIYSEHES